MKSTVILKLCMVTLAAASFMLLLWPSSDTAQIADVVKPGSLNQTGGIPDERLDFAVATARKGSNQDEIDWKSILATQLNEPTLEPGDPELLAIFRLIAANKFTEALKLRSQLNNKTAKKIVTWKLFDHRRYDMPIVDMKDFVDDNPDWPSLHRLRAKAESKMFKEKPDSRIIFEYFKNKQASTSSGRIALARAFDATEQSERVEQIVVSTWRDDKLSTKIELAILREFGHLLQSDDHLYRAHRLLYDNNNTAVNRAKPLLKFVEEAERNKLEVRIAMIQRQKKARKLLSGLTREEKNDPAVAYSTVKWYQRSKQKTKSLALMKIVEPVTNNSVIADKWWKLRRYFIFEAINTGQPKSAYKIAKNYGSVSVNNLNQANFLSGWIALRFLKKPELAQKHFTDLSQSADGPRSRSRAQYWLGRTAIAMKQTDKANRHFRQGAEYFNTYYGLLSRQTLDPKSTSITISQPPDPSPEKIKKFFGREAVQALMLAHKSGLKLTTHKLLSRLNYRITDPQELMLLAELSDKIGNVQQVVRIGKRAMFFGYPFTNYAYPINALPKFTPIRPLPESALIYAITRQESEFNPNIVSRAGARGLMQVMPTTAKHVSRQHKIKYELKKLLSDPAYNCRIASAYIADRMDEFGGSYIKTIAGFNAGPGRVRQWIKKFGDPSRSDVDPVDWIERIPFTETRNYVQKVLANIQIYRARLGAPKSALMIRPDLDRGRS